jgi:hypothetical protein
VVSYLVGDLALILSPVSQLHPNLYQTETYLAAVDAPQVKRVARELNTVRPLDKRCAVSLCPQSVPNPKSSLPFLQSLTGDLPRKVSGNSGGHFIYFGREVRSCRYSREVRRSMVAVARLYY